MLMLAWREWLHKNVGRIVMHRNIMKYDVALRYLIMSVMIMRIDVLGTSVADIVVCEGNKRLIISENWDWNE